MVEVQRYWHAALPPIVGEMLYQLCAASWGILLPDALAPTSPTPAKGHDRLSKPVSNKLHKPYSTSKAVKNDQTESSAMRAALAQLWRAAALTSGVMPFGWEKASSTVKRELGSVIFSSPEAAAWIRWICLRTVMLIGSFPHTVSNKSTLAPSWYVSPKI